jgi:hypothetical protein
MILSSHHLEVCCGLEDGLVCGLADKLLRSCDTGMVFTLEALASPEGQGTCSRDAIESLGNINSDKRTPQLPSYTLTRHTTLTVSVLV